MATVYRALDGKLGRSVAIKVFRPGQTGGEVRRLGEATVLSRLNHPNLVVVHDAHLVDEGSSEPSFIVMELVDGPSLRSELDVGPLTGLDAAVLSAELAEALVVVHDAGVVHRDIKPANILLAPTALPSPLYRAKLADFGIAHLLGAERVTTDGTIIGTAAYLSPEQARGAEPGPAADIYSLGLVLLESLTGRRVYPGTPIESVSARLHSDPAIPSGLPASWHDLLRQMTSRTPELRPHAIEIAMRAREAADDLANWPARPAASVNANTYDLRNEVTSAIATEPLLLADPDAATLAMQGAATQSERGRPIPVSSEHTVPGTATSASRADRGRRRTWVAATLVAAALVGGAIAATSAIDRPDAPNPSSTSSTPSTNSQPTPAPRTSTTKPGATPAATPVVTPIVPPSTAPITNSGPGNSGHGNGKGNGNGNGNGNGGGKKNK
jgi:eukaryotic-like serine/threonine-protein kinase